jgi:protease II
METLPAEGTPGMWQIVRTGLNDSQVFPYESAKWVIRSRGGEATRPILLAIEGGQGHFVTGATAVEQEAEDLAVLLFFTDRWASKKAGNKKSQVLI